MIQNHGKPRKRERSVFLNKEVDKAQFPITERRASFTINDPFFFLEGYENICYVVLRNKEQDWYIDIYYVYCFHSEIKLRRFIIVPGFQMELRDEIFFLDRIADNLCIDFNIQDSSKFVREINEIAPELRLKDYSDMGTILAHIYFTSFQSGIRKQLFMAGGLDIIAMNFSKIEEINLKAGDLEEAFDGIHIEMLRKLNSEIAVEVILKTKKNREKAAGIYSEYGKLLKDVKQLSEFQFRYLLECLNGKYKKPVKRVLNLFSGVETRWDEEYILYLSGNRLYEGYMEYRSLLLSDKKLMAVFPLYPSLQPDAIVDFWRLGCLLKDYAAYGQELEKMLEEYAVMWEKLYSFEDEKYVIKFPVCMRDYICDAGKEYEKAYFNIYHVLFADHAIAFIRKKESPDEPCKSVRINCNWINNDTSELHERRLTVDQEAFVEKYARALGLGYKRIMPVRREEMPHLDMENRDNLFMQEICPFYVSDEEITDETIL